MSPHKIGAQPVSDAFPHYPPSPNLKFWLVNLMNGIMFHQSGANGILESGAVGLSVKNTA